MENRVAYVRASGIYDDSRATKEIMAIADFAEHVYVLSWDRSGCAEEKCRNVFQKYTNISFHFFPVPVKGISIGLKNIDKLFNWNRWIRKTLSSLSGVNVVHACNLDSGIGAYWYSKHHKVKLVYDIYDYYIDSHNIPSVLQDIVEREEIKIINYADTTVICTEERREQLANSSPQRIAVIHNSPDVDEVKHEAELYNYVYCGTLGGGRLIAEILDQYPSHSEMNFVFAGYGANAVAAEELSKKFNNFCFEGSVPYSRVIELEKKAMAISAIYKPDIRNHRLCAPNKFYEALALSKPVIVCRGTGIDQIVEKNHIGIVIDYNAESFYQALEYLCRDENARNEMGKRARELYEIHYQWKIMKDRITEIYKNI